MSIYIKSRGAEKLEKSLKLLNNLIKKAREKIR